MPKRKKHPKLPNGYGTIRYLGKGRRNPYSVQPPAYEDPETGRYISPTAYFMFQIGMLVLLF